MFWGCFSKGPSLFQEKEWGTISEKSYQEHTLPLIHKLILKIKGITSSFISCKMGLLDIEHVGHLQSYKNVEFVLFFQPPYSPNLKPIENCQNQIKDYIEDKWELQEKPLYNNLRRYIQEAQDTLPNEYWRKLMPARLYIE